MHVSCRRRKEHPPGEAFQIRGLDNNLGRAHVSGSTAKPPLPHRKTLTKKGIGRKEQTKLADVPVASPLPGSRSHISLDDDLTEAVDNCMDSQILVTESHNDHAGSHEGQSGQSGPHAKEKPSLEVQDPTNVVPSTLETLRVIEIESPAHGSDKTEGVGAGPESISKQLAQCVEVPTDISQLVSNSLETLQEHMHAEPLTVRDEVPGTFRPLQFPSLVDLKQLFLCN